MPLTIERRRVLISRLLLFLLMVLVYGSSPVVQNGDAFLVSATAHSLLDDGDLTIDEHLGPATDGGAAVVADGGSIRGPVRGSDLPRRLPAGEHAFDYYPWPTSVFAVPVVLAYDVAALSGIERLDPDRLLATGDVGPIALATASLLTALTVVVLSAIAWWALLDLPDARRRRAAFVVGLVAGLATPAWSTLSRAPWNQTVATLFTSIAVLSAFKLAIRPAAWSPTRMTGVAAALGASAAATYLARPTGAVLVLGLGVWLLVIDRRSVPWAAAGGLLVTVPWVAVNLATWGRPQPPYYDSERAGLSSETLEGMAANLVSPNRGLFVFSSITVLSVIGFAMALRQRGPVPRGLAIALASIVVMHLVVVAGSGEAWWAGASYGPRFMADVVPQLLLLAMPVVAAAASGGLPSVAQRALAILVVLSIVMHLPGAWSKPAQCWNVDPVAIDDDPSRVWHWDDMQAFRPLSIVLEGGSLRDAALQRCESDSSAAGVPAQAFR